MRTHAQWMVYKELELIPDSATTESTTLHKQLSWFIHLWVSVMGRPCTTMPPRIEERRDRHGNTVWVAYDLATGNIAWLNSEFEVLDWIDQLELCRLQALYQSWWRKG